MREEILPAMFTSELTAAVEMTRLSVLRRTCEEVLTLSHTTGRPGACGSISDVR